MTVSRHLIIEKTIINYCNDHIDHLLRLYDFDKVSELLREYCKKMQDEPTNDVDEREFRL